MANSLGSLYIDIQARTATLESDMEKVKQAMGKVKNSTDAAGESAKSAFKSFQLFNSFQGRGMTGIALDMASFFMLIQAVKQEIKYVIDNIDRIPGIPAETVSNVNEFKVSIKSARDGVDKFIAEGISGFLQFSKAVGAGLASVFFGVEAMNESLKAQLDTMDALALASDPTYYDKLRAAQVKLSEARKADAAASKNQADKIVELRKQAEAYNTFAQSHSINSLQATEAQTKATNDLTAADKIHLELRKQFDAFSRKLAADEIKDTFVELSQRDKMLELEKKIGEAMVETGQMRANVKGQTIGDLTDAQLEAANKKFPVLLGWMAQYREELKKIRTSSMEWRDLTVRLSDDLNNFLTSFVTGGKITINSFLKTISDSIISMFIKLAIINPILNGLFGHSKGFGTLASMWAGKADGGPASGLTLVGERGPELINLGSGSTVIPNHNITGGRGNGMTVYMDARGADEARIQTMERNLAFMNATFERRVLGTIVSGKSRRGSTGVALA